MQTSDTAGTGELIYTVADRAKTRKTADEKAAAAERAVTAA